MPSDENRLTFARFVDHVTPNCVQQDSFSYVNPRRSYRVSVGSMARLPSQESVQRFDEQDLLPIAKELGLSLPKTAKLIALRNAWLWYFQENELASASPKEGPLQTSNEFVADYLVLSSPKWLQHPVMRGSSCIFVDDDSVGAAEAWNRYKWQSWIQDEEKNGKIWGVLNDWHNQHSKRTYTSLEERDADYAANDIKLAKRRIQELRAEIEAQEAIICAARRPIRKFQKIHGSSKKAAPGRPKISEVAERQQRRDVALEFVSQWVASLMNALSIDSCGALAKTVCGQKMTWWRWLNKEMLPSPSSLGLLLDVKIKTGPNQHSKLRDIQTSPTLADLIDLVDLV